MPAPTLWVSKKTALAFWLSPINQNSIVKSPVKPPKEEAFEIAINFGATDCIQKKDIHEIITKKEDFYKVKSELEKKIDNFDYSAIEWRPLNNLDLNKEKSKKIEEILNVLEDLDDVQNIFTNAILKNW